MNEAILWIRTLSCGHERPTNMPFVAKDYTKPKVGDFVLCRECWMEVAITKVKKADDNQTKQTQRFWDTAVQNVQNKVI